MIVSALRNVTTSLAFVGALAMPAGAQEKSNAQVVFDMLALPDILEVMNQEGMGYGADIGSGLFQGNPSPEWTATVAQIYDTENMRTQVLAQLTDALDGEDIGPITDFFGSELGQRIVMLEVAARRALLDDAVETASKEVAALAMADETPRYALVTDFIDANDLIEVNVVGALNTNVAFFLGLMEGGAMGDEMSEAEILNNAWGQEPEIRANTIEWIYSFLMLAYQPLTDAELQAYIDFSRTDAGRDINAAMFASFDGLFEEISHALGFASTQVALTEEL